MPLPYSLTYCHTVLAEHLQPGHWVLDATAGNGHDTLFLAKSVAPAGRVFAFDIQPEAIANTTARLEQQGLAALCHCTLAGHENMSAHLPSEAQGRLQAAMFNLGFLPRGDRSIITKPATTCAALEALLPWMAPRGIVTVLCYLGHTGGQEEAAAVARYCEALPWVEWRALRYGYVNEASNQTVLYCLERRKTHTAHRERP